MHLAFISLPPILSFSQLLTTKTSIINTFKMSSSDPPPSSSSSSHAYQPPKVWTFSENNTNTWSSTNRPTAGARFDCPLKRGKHPFQLYSMATPNGQKITIMLEELLEMGILEAEYDAWLVEIGKGDQFGSGFVNVNPNSKIPAMLDYTNCGNDSEDATTAVSSLTPVRLFESGSILLYLADKFQAFLPSSLRTEVLNWLFWQVGSAPYLGGGFGHFYVYAKEKQEYPIDRFTMEVKRQLHLLELQLKENKYLAGDEYTIADIAVWPWYGLLVLGRLYNDSATFLNINQEYPNVIRWANEVEKRPAVRRGSIVNKTWGDGPKLAERHDQSDFNALGL